MFPFLFSMLAPAGRNSRLSILIFHRVHRQGDELFPTEPSAADFDALMGKIKDWFNVIPLDEAIIRLASGTLPARPLCITFDDGYADNYQVALPILVKHQLQATFFIATGFLEGGRMFNDSIVETIRCCNLELLDLKSLGFGAHSLKAISERQAAINSLINAIKYLPQAKRTEATELIAEAAGVQLPIDLMMSRAEVRGLRQAGMLVGAHTRSHPILARTTLDQAEGEIVAGRNELETILGEKVTVFAYPNGKPGTDYLPEHVDIIRKQNFLGAVSTAWGSARMGADPFQLPRFTPWDSNLTKFGLRMATNLRR